MAAGQLDFGWEDVSERLERRSKLPLAAKLADQLRELSRRQIFVGTSSWKYSGWLGQVYEPARYRSGGRFSRKKFEQQCLAEYATVFPTVCGDFGFYQFPSAVVWEHTFAQVPDGFRFSLKVPEEVTAQRFGNLPRYGRRAGAENPDFMNADLLRDKLLARLEPYRENLGPLIFEFGTIHEEPMSQPAQFAARLDEMLSDLPTERYRFAVEVRNRAFLGPESDYLAVLRRHHVAHCLNSWTRMPSISEQMQVPDVLTADHVVARFLLRPGRSYQQAVEMFSPYERVQDTCPEGRQALRGLVQRCLAEQRALFAFVNNRLEGNAPETIAWTTR